MGVYTFGGGYRGDLAKTGLIIPPSKSPSTLRHEFKHFEDIILYGSIRTSFDSAITEINSRMVDVAAGEMDWDTVKGKLAKSYLGDVDSIGYESAKAKMESAVDVVSRMQKNKVPEDAITPILLHAQRFEGIISWGNVGDDQLRELAEKSAIQ